MNELFVPCEIAIKMKELGFNEPCLAYFNLDPYFKTPPFTVSKPFDHEWLIPAPLYQQVFKWFREKHMKSPRFCIDTNGWYFTITQFTESGSSLTDSKLAPLAKQDYKTYEEAELGCINKMLELIKP